MSCGRGQFVPSRAGRLRRAIAAAGGILALTLSTGLWSGSAALAQETQIIYPGSMAVTGFPDAIRSLTVTKR